MLVNISLLNELFRGFSIQRWNDKIRPIEFTEMDKHAHKMIIAYALGKYEEMAGKKVNWINIIKGGIFELFRRIVISDIKSPIFYKIKVGNHAAYTKLNEWVYNKLEAMIENEEIKQDLFNYLNNEDYLDKHSAHLLAAAHRYASYWEFQIIKLSNPPDSYSIKQIERELLNDIHKYLDEFIGLQHLMTKKPIHDFIDLCGQLRFQIRWAQIPRVPKTSVLGHSMTVAVLSYFFALENNACPKRLYNDFYGGLFHDLPEAVTRDIISPVKKSSEEFENFLKELELELAQEEIFPLIEKEWIPEIKYFILDEFENRITVDNEIKFENYSINDINEKYNSEEFNPVDGELIRTADHLAAFLEAWHSSNYGIKSEDMTSAMQTIKQNYANKNLGKTNIKSLYLGFNSNF
jgi:putative hydrolase of HD superfamily